MRSRCPWRYRVFAKCESVWTVECSFDIEAIARRVLSAERLLGGVTGAEADWSTAGTTPLDWVAMDVALDCPEGEKAAAQTGCGSIGSLRSTFPPTNALAMTVIATAVAAGFCFSFSLLNALACPARSQRAVPLGGPLMTASFIGLLAGNYLFVRQ